MSCENCQFHKNISRENNQAEVSESTLGSCSKLNSYDWLKEISGGSLKGPVEVRFKNTRKEFFRNPEEIRLKTGDIVAVEAPKGHDIGIVSLTGRVAYLQFKSKNPGGTAENLNQLYRKAHNNDMDRWIGAREREEGTLIRAREIALSLGLVMKLSEVEYQGDASAATFYYTAEDRVDFRELIKHYTREFGIRVVMKQIGMRQEAAMIGGIGSCGRELCCSTWRTNLTSVSMDAAKRQQLSPNAQKLTGQCGKLKCCLMYELEVYLEAMDDFPNELLELETKRGVAYPGRIEALRKMVWYTYGEKSETGAIPVTLDRIREIIMMNKKGKQPDDLVK